MRSEILLAALVLNVGALETIGLDPTTHLGVYPYVAIGTALPVADTPVTLIPQVGVEGSPEFSTWGFTGVLTTDIRLSKRVGLDFNIAFIHDQYKAAWADALYLGGVGTGLSFGPFDRLTISPFVNVFTGLNAEVHAVTPGVNAAWEL